MGVQMQRSGAIRVQLGAEANQPLVVKGDKALIEGQIEIGR